ncbi:unnamed protein product [Arabis nemorensis]|uniref:Epidermal patterning factor-like protein n=1 Tax=Arabis nemorensis TaxID=586526 RepID=A0A565B252_9BRAS|nr:unnamed protein product [Arabis nemorensis]
MMKSISLFAILLLHLFISSNSLRLDLFNYVASGSTIPDCSHACGPCRPCKLVVITSKCSGSEACPVVYKCLCKGKYYHFQSLTKSLLTARLRTNRGEAPSVIRLPAWKLGCGVTFEDDAGKVFDLAAWIRDFLVRQLAITEHLPSLSELETE